jgi:hypothetical protein
MLLIYQITLIFDYMKQSYCALTMVAMLLCVLLFFCVTGQLYQFVVRLYEMVPSSLRVMPRIATP